jgi:serine/threonine-protein kinase
VNEPTIVSKNPPLVAGAAVLSVAEISGLVPGDRLDHFEIERFVGGGGMGSVYRALDTMLNRTVAIKVLSPENAADEETVGRFRNEARSAARLDHENIARVYFVGHDRGMHYIAFEFVEGVNLRDMVARHGPLSAAEALDYMLQAAAALDHAAGRDVVHRDIKPSNLLVTPEGRLKLVDMGLARLYQVDQSGGELTASGVTLGTFDYISPEQARDPRSVDARSDLYSLGCTLFFMLVGRPPFPSGTVLQKLLQHQGDSPPDPREHDPSLPADLSRILQKLLAKDPRNRYQSARALSIDLEILAAGLGVVTRPGLLPHVAAPAAPASKWVTHLPWIVPTALLLFIVVLVGASRSADPVLPPIHPLALSEPPPRPDSRATTTQPGAAHRPKAGERDGAEAPAPPSPNNGSSGGASTPSLAANSGPVQAVPLPDETDVMPPVTVIPSPLTDADRPPSVEGAGTPAVSPAGPRERIVYVGDETVGEPRYPSLAAACAAAQSGDTIEVCFSGRRTEKPLSLYNKHLVIRSGRGYRPVIVFRANPADFTNAPPWAMISVTGQTLTLVGLAIELEIPRDVAVATTGWSLLATQRAQAIRLERCFLTVKNATAQNGALAPNVVFVDVRSSPGTRPGMMDESAPPAPLLLELANSVARGEATFLRSNEQQPVNLSWDNGLVSTSERFLECAAGPMPLGFDSSVRVDLNRVTLSAKGGMCLLLNDEPAAHPPVHVSVENSIVLVGDSQIPLIDEFLAGNAAESTTRLTWSGMRTHYVRLGVYWRWTSLGPDSPPEPWDQAAWLEHWGPAEQMSRSNDLTWRRLADPASIPHAHLPADFRLDEEDPAHGWVGFDPYPLPEPPPEFDAPQLTRSEPDLMDTMNP